MTVDEALEVLGYLLGHEKAVDSGEMEDVQNCLNSQEQEALKVILSEFRELKEKATEKKPKMIGYRKDGEPVYECGCCGSTLAFADQRFCMMCSCQVDWSEGKE